MKYLLALIWIFFLFTRLYKIAEIPPSVYWDEASIGYNAYSIVQTGKDEWGESFPLHFRAFGEFKLPVYIYSSVPFVKIFGLNEFSVRIPSVLFSLGVIIISYFLAKKISGSSWVGLFSSFFISISPWFFIFSRTGYEATAGLMFYLLAILFFLQSERGGKFILFSIISFILSSYSYNSFRIISPLTILVLIIFERNNLKHLLSKQKVLFVTSVFFLILAVIPIYRLYVYDAGITRLQAVGNVSGIDAVRNYLSHFSPQFLLLQGDKNLRSQQVGFGQLYFPDLFLIIFGLFYIIRDKTKYRWLPLTFLLLGPIPAAITKESPHALRALSQVPFYAVILAQGVLFLGRFLRRKYLLEVLLLTIFLGFFGQYFINFVKVYSNISSKAWQYDYKRIFTGSELQTETKDKIYISDEWGQPYIFALFYLRYDPEKFRSEVVRNSVDKWGFSTVKSFSKFEFFSK